LKFAFFTNFIQCIPEVLIYIALIISFLQHFILFRALVHLAERAGKHCNYYVLEAFIAIFVREFRIIANGNKIPLAENMVIAIEPKCGIEGIGMVGAEETFVVKASGPICITGGAKEIMVL